jgi:hypothetical protein
MSRVAKNKFLQKSLKLSKQLRKTRQDQEMMKEKLKNPQLLRVKREKNFLIKASWSFKILLLRLVKVATVRKISLKATW